MLGVRAATLPVLLATTSLEGLLAAPAAAAINAWSRIGPPGGALVCELATNPGDEDRLWAGLSYGGIFTSRDGGETWSSAGGEIVWQFPCRLAVEAANPDHALALEEISKRLRRSVDGGGHWTQVTTPNVAGDPLTDVAYAPLEPGIAYLSSWGHLYRSTDGGARWRSVFADLPEPVVIQRIRPHPTRPAEIWLATSLQGVQRSRDGGTSFESLNAGLPDVPTVHDLVFDPTNPERIYLWVEDGIRRSEDGGASWSPPIAVGEVFGIEVGADGAVWLRLGGGEVLRSVDQGATWQELSGAPRTAGFKSAGSALWSWGDPGLRRTQDGGTHWTERSEGLDAAAINNLLAVRGEPTRLLYVDNIAWQAASPLVESADRGATWQRGSLDSAGFHIVFAEALRVDENDPDRRALFGMFSGPAAESGSYGPVRTEDGGRTWFLSAQTGLWNCLFPTDLDYDAVESGRLLLSGRPVTSGCAFLPDRCTAFRSFDGGSTWSCLFAPVGPAPHFIPHFSAAPGRPGALLGNSAEGVERSLDFGDSWQVVATPPAGEGLAYMAPVWSGPDHAWVATGGGNLLRTMDGGAHWTTRAGPGPGILQLAADPIRPDTLYLRTQAAVYVTDDGGQSYEALAAGLPPVELSALVVDPIEPDRLYLATLGAGILEYQRRAPRPCVASDEVHCLRDGRFEVRALWQDFLGYRGRAKTLALTDETGAFWFFDPANYELAVKLLDGRPLTETFWTFFASLSNVEYRLLVTDAETGASHGYFNPAGRFASVGDVNSLPAEGALAPVAASTVAGLRNEAALATDCAPGPGTLCLRDGRFALEVAWADFQGGSGGGVAVPLSSDTGAFWFFDDANVELLVKVLDGTGTNGRYWVFFGALSNVEFELTVRDLWTGAVKVYRNPPGRHASVGDVDAFLP